MPDRPDYATLTRGQIALLDRINAGETGAALLGRIVRLARQTLGGSGAGFTEWAGDHGRIVAADGFCEHALGRRVEHAAAELLPDGARTRLVPAAEIETLVAEELTGVRRALGARCELGGLTVGFLHVYYTELDGLPGQEHHDALTVLAGLLTHLYATRSGLPVHSDGPAVPDDSGLVEHWKRRHEDRDLFVAVTSHELRTPVTVIKGYADTLTNHWETLGPQGRQEAVRVIGARAGELARLVDRLLSATSDDGGITGPPGPFDLVEAVRTAAGELPSALTGRLILDRLPAELPKAFGDRESLATILTELATNADKYSPSGSEITLEAAADDTTVTLRVCDRGIGVRPEHAELAFERYWQGEPGDGGRNPGTGLGLYLVRRIVERQHGWVYLRPRDGGGTVVEVRFPRA
jgi:signal transduction histidine kinase